MPFVLFCCTLLVVQYCPSVIPFSSTRGIAMKDNKQLGNQFLFGTLEARNYSAVFSVSLEVRVK